MILNKDAFDPEAVFLDDIVDDDVLPRLTLAVDGLTDPGPRARVDCELVEDIPEPIKASTHLPDTALDPEQLEVYGWESSFWRKFKSYFGL